MKGSLVRFKDSFDVIGEIIDPVTKDEIIQGVEMILERENCPIWVHWIYGPINKRNIYSNHKLDEIKIIGSRKTELTAKI